MAIAIYGETGHGMLSFAVFIILWDLKETGSMLKEVLGARKDGEETKRPRLQAQGDD
jgi:hypothetical protein